MKSCMKLEIIIQFLLYVLIEILTYVNLGTALRDFNRERSNYILTS